MRHKLLDTISKMRKETEYLKIKNEKLSSYASKKLNEALTGIDFELIENPPDNKINEDKSERPLKNRVRQVLIK